MWMDFSASNMNPQARRILVIATTIALAALLTWMLWPSKDAQPAAASSRPASLPVSALTKPATTSAVEAPKLAPVGPSDTPSKPESVAGLSGPILITDFVAEPVGNGRNFGTVELRDGVTTKLLTASGHWFVIHPKLLPDGRMQMDLDIEQDDGTVVRSLPQHISTLGHTYGTAGGPDGDVDFTPHW